MQPVEIERVQQRTLRVLFSSAVFGRAATTLAFTVASLLIKDMLGGPTWAGLSTVAITIGAAISSNRLSVYMTQVGRRRGLTVGYGLGVAGSVVATVGAQLSWLPLFLFGLVFAGVGSGAINLSRYAAADLAAPDKKAKAISLVVFASTVGAVGGPTLVDAADRVGKAMGLVDRVGPLFGSVLLMLVGGVIVTAALRPDPLQLSGGLGADATRTSGRSAGGVMASLRVISAHPLSRLALASLVVSQAVMVGVMAMTPLHMDAHGHSLGLIGWVISAHTAGMYAFAPLVGWAADRFGGLIIISAGGVVLALATLCTALAGDASPVLMFAGLYLLGLGWCLCMVAGSALLTSIVPAEERVAAQGAADLLSHLVSGIAALSSGVVLGTAGFGVLSTIGLVGAAALLAVVIVSTLSPTAH